jgi:hypothetical protein
MFTSERAQKMLQHVQLDVKKFDDTAENEACQISKMIEIADLQGRPWINDDDNQRHFLKC